MSDDVVEIWSVLTAVARDWPTLSGPGSSGVRLGGLCRWEGWGAVAGRLRGVTRRLRILPHKPCFLNLPTALAKLQNLQRKPLVVFFPGF